MNSPGKFLFMWMFSFLLPPATVIAFLRGRLPRDEGGDYERRLGVGIIVSIAAWSLVLQTIPLADYFSVFPRAVEASWRESSYEVPSAFALSLLAAAGCSGLYARKRIDPRRRPRG